jgi:hypothetical protein
MRSRKYPLPDFLAGILSEAAYLRWLHRKADAHIERDRERGNTTATREQYKVAIHAAVLSSRGRDVYTGSVLRWDQVSTFNNAEAKKNGRAYKRQFADMPTVDHLDDGRSAPRFAICSWKTNDAKSDLSHEEFVQLCRDVLAYHGAESAHVS